VGVGITRSIIGDEPPDPTEEALNDVLHWVWSWRVQTQRLLSSTAAEGQAATELDVRRSLSLATYDEHMLVVAGWNLARALARGGSVVSAVRIAEDKHKALRLLRNLYEHWDEQRPAFQDPAKPKLRSAKEFAELFPKGQPWSITYMKNDWLLGGVVGINAITDALVSIEGAALEMEKQLRNKGGAA
jgi:hypothetical protein